MVSISSSALRPGSIFEDDGRKYIVLKFQHIKKGRGQAINRVKVKDLESGTITEKTYTNEQSVSEADVSKKSAQFLYTDGSAAHFMDTNDFNQFQLDTEVVEEELKFLTEGMKVITLYIDGNPISVELPVTVELQVQETEPAVTGNTAQNAMKNALLETGLEIKVPLFLKQGDYVKINTQSGEYIGRVS
ncbi:MAG: elongation factor P [Candidatus Dojkabacteria bacterium]